MSYDSFDRMEAAFERAENLRIQGSFLEAYNIYLEILQQRLVSRTQLQWADTVVIQSLADLTLLLGHFQAADDLFNGLVSLYREGDNPALAHFTILKRIHLALDFGLLRQADTFFRTLQPQIGELERIDISPSGLVEWEQSCSWDGIEQNGQAVLFAYVYLGLGRLLAALGQYTDALVTLGRGLSYTQANYPSLARLTALPMKFAIAAAYLEKGELTAARTQLQTLQTQFNPERQPEASVRWLELSGKLNLLQGRLGEGLQQFGQVQSICHQLQFPRASIQATLNLAHVLIILNQTQSARDYLMDALAEVKHPARAKITDASELQNRIELLMALADARGQSLVSDDPISVSSMRDRRLQDSSTVTEQQQVEILPTTQSANYLAFFEDRVLGFHRFLSQLNLEQANSSLMDLRQVFEDTDSQLIHLKIRSVQAIFFYYQGVTSQNEKRIRYAADLLKEIYPFLEELDLKPELWQVKRMLGWCWVHLNEPTQIQEKLARETNELLTQLTDSLPPEAQAIYLLNKWTADEEFIATRINQLQRLRKKLTSRLSWFLPWRHWSLNQQIHYLLEHIDRYKDVLAKRTIRGCEETVRSASHSSFFNRIRTHPKDRITLLFLVLPDRVLAVRIGWLMLDFRVISVTRLEVRNLVQSWHQKIRGVNGKRDFSQHPNEESYELTMEQIKQEVQEISAQVTELLQIPSLLAGLPKRIKAITIIPDDILHGFPFATIVERGKYLPERYALSIAYESNNKTLQTPTTTDKIALLIGISENTQQFAALPAVKPELEKVAQWLTLQQFNVSVLLDRAADKEVILPQLTKAKLLHMACHGKFEYQNPDRSGLVLISPEQQPEILTLRELSNLDLSHLHHVTLSACWSADHFILPGRWIVSLPETLWRSGTHSILGCLWEVYDRLAVEFMTHFYTYLETLPREQALRRTQLDFLYGLHSHPIYWAGFTLYGDYSRLTEIQKR